MKMLSVLFGVASLVLMTSYSEAQAPTPKSSKPAVAKKNKKGEAGAKSQIEAKTDPDAKSEAKPQAKIEESPPKVVEAPADEGVTVKVIKSQPGRAVIRHSKKIKLERKRYSLEKYHKPGEDDEDPSRDYFLGASMDMGLFSETATAGGTETKTELKSFLLSSSFGKNFGWFEAGLFVEYAFRTVGTIDSKTLLGGLLLDINFGANDLDANGIFGLRVSAGTGQEDASNLTEAGKVTRLQPSLFWKWFGLSESVALVLEVGHRNQTTEYGSLKVVSTGVIGRVGVLGYF